MKSKSPITLFSIVIFTFSCFTRYTRSCMGGVYIAIGLFGIRCLDMLELSFEHYITPVGMTSPIASLNIRFK